MSFSIKLDSRILQDCTLIALNLLMPQSKIKSFAFLASHLCCTKFELCKELDFLIKPGRSFLLGGNSSNEFDYEKLENYQMSFYKSKKICLT